MNNLPEGTVLFGGRESKTRVLDTVYGRVALVEWTEYCQGEAMGAIAERLNAAVVLLLNDGELDTFTVEQAEDMITKLQAAVAEGEVDDGSPT